MDDAEGNEALYEEEEVLFIHRHSSNSTTIDQCRRYVTPGLTPYATTLTHIINRKHGVKNGTNYTSGRDQFHLVRLFCERIHGVDLTVTRPMPTPVRA